MKDLIVVGAGGFAKEIAFLVRNSVEFNLIGFVDDSLAENSEVVGKKILGSTATLVSWQEHINVAIGIASPIVKQKVYQRLKDNKNLTFPNIISQTADIGINVKLGIGNILMSNTTYTADIDIGNFNMINIGSTIGHDTKIGNYNSIFPTVNISGNVNIGDSTEIGVGTKIIQKIVVEDNSVIGAGSTVIKNIEKNTKNVGVPTRVIERWK